MTLVADDPICPLTSSTGEVFGIARREQNTARSPAFAKPPRARRRAPADDAAHVPLDVSEHGNDAPAQLRLAHDAGEGVTA